MKEATTFYHRDCRHFRGDIPCAPNKREGVHCSDCPYYDPVTENILIIKLGAAGDVIRTTPILEPLKKEHPSARIWWLTESPQLVPQSLVDKILKWDSQSLETLKVMRFARLLNLDKDRHACALASAIQADRKDGFVLGPLGESEPANERAMPKFVTGIFDDVNLANHKDYPMELFEICGYEFKGEKYRIDKPENIAFPNLDTSKPLVGVNTGAGARWTSRLWDVQKWIELANTLLDEGKGVLLLGGPDEDARNKAIQQGTKGRAQYLGTFPIPEFIALVDRCELIVTGVTMCMHIAIALEKKLVLLNNIFNPYEFGDLYGLGLIVQPDKQCMCFFRGQCINPDYFCLDHMPVAKVKRAIDEVWKAPIGKQKQEPLVSPGLIISPRDIISR